jgi:hypothetical protein
MAGTPVPANTNTRGEITDPAVRERTELTKPDAGPPGELRPLVQNQLLGLSQHTLAWEGLAWPGQMMKIEIDDPRGDPREPGGDRKDEAAADVPWTSRLRLVLPGLGEVETSLTLWRDHGLAVEFFKRSGGPYAHGCRIDGAPAAHDRCRSAARLGQFRRCCGGTRRIADSSGGR